MKLNRRKMTRKILITQPRRHTTLMSREVHGVFSNIKENEPLL